MNITDALKSVFMKYATFKGRARRSEYWYFILASIIISIVIGIIGLFMPAVGSILNMVFSLGILLPSLAVLTRRLHDVGKSGWYVVWPYVLLTITLGCIFAGIGMDNLAMAATRPEAIDANQMNIPLLMVGLGFYLVTLIYGIYLLILTCRDSQLGTNQYGENPKGEEEIATNDNF